MSKNLKNLMTAPMVSRVCECDLKTVHNWVARGEIKSFRTPGRHLRFLKSDVVEFLEKHGYPVPAELEREKKTSERSDDGVCHSVGVGA